SHSKKCPGSSAVTRQTSGGSFGCLIRAQLPTASSPGSSRRTLVTEAVHSGQRSTSAMIDQTRSGGASTLIERSILIPQSFHQMVLYPGLLSMSRNEVAAVPVRPSVDWIASVGARREDV